MATSHLEQVRRHHEDAERYQRLIVDVLMEPTKTHKDDVVQLHKVKRCIDNIVDISNQLEEKYEDRDHLMADDVAAITALPPNVFSLFYDRLRDIREYHRKFPNLVTDRPEETVYNAVMPHNELERFRGEEGAGRFLDLHELHAQYLNLNRNKHKHMDYTAYVLSFDKFDDDLASKDKAYERYLTNLSDYLKDFHCRAKPLNDFDELIKQMSEDFDQKWDDDTGIQWRADETTAVTSASDGGALDDIDFNDIDMAEAPPPPAEDEELDLDRYAEAFHLETIGLKRLKKELQDRGLKCGGSLEERAERLFRAKGRSRGEYDASDVAVSARDQILESIAAGVGGAKKKRLRKKKGGKGATAASNADFWKAIARLEHSIVTLGNALSDERVHTKLNIEKKQSRDPAMFRRELEESDSGSDVEVDVEPEDEITIGIKNYPVGWDGKPIPFWLYKLHGLGIEFKCEICGNYSYFGRRAFERHFQERRHAHGMRCLGIPNTVHFHEITNIQDALNLWEKVRKDEGELEWDAERDEQYENADGHVFAKKTYMDLKRQGLWKE